VAASVVNRGPAAVNNVQVTLELDGRAVETQTDLGAARRARVRHVSAVHARRAFTRGHVRIGDDSLKQDNAFHFVVSPAQRLSVLIVDRRARRAKRACICRRRCRSDDAGFQVDMRQGESVASTDLDRHRVVILNDVAALSSGDVLKSFVSKGGGLLGRAWVSEPTGAPTRTIFLPAVPGQRRRSPGPRRRARRARHQPPGARALQSSAKRKPVDRAILRYRAVTQNPEPAGDKEGRARAEQSRVIARFDDGQLRWPSGTIGIGSGHDLVVHARQLRNDLALKPVYLPFVHELIRHLATYENRRTGSPSEK
jgi:hypothetical protein